MFIGSLFLLMLLFHVMITHFVFVIHLRNIDLIDFYNNDISLNLLSRYKHGLLAVVNVAA